MRGRRITLLTQLLRASACKLYPAFLGREEAEKLHLRLLQGTGFPVAEVEWHTCFHCAVVQGILWFAWKLLMSQILAGRWGGRRRRRGFSVVCLSVMLLACAVYSDCVRRTWCLLYAAGWNSVQLLWVGIILPRAWLGRLQRVLGILAPLSRLCNTWAYSSSALVGASDIFWNVLEKKKFAIWRAMSVALCKGSVTPVLSKSMQGWLLSRGGNCSWDPFLPQLFNLLNYHCLICTDFLFPFPCL